MENLSKSFPKPFKNQFKNYLKIIEKYIQKPLQNLSKNLPKINPKTYPKTYPKPMILETPKKLVFAIYIYIYSILEQPGLTLEREARLIIELY